MQRDQARSASVSSSPSGDGVVEADSADSESAAGDAVEEVWRSRTHSPATKSRIAPRMSKVAWSAPMWLLRVR
jgi:hypothetical protein